MSIESQVKGILKRVVNEDPDLRYEALDELNGLKENNHNGLDKDVLIQVIETAANPFPKPVDKWDEPSFYLIDFVSDFRGPELSDAIVKNFADFSLFGKQRAVDFLLEVEEERSFAAFFEILERNLDVNTAIIPVDSLMERPMLAKRVMEKFYTYINNTTYKIDFYHLLSYLHAQDVFYQFKQKEILPILVADYQVALKQYKEYESDYNPKHVYCSWKDKYLEIRERLDLLLDLFVYYFSDETEQFLKDALFYKDPTLNARAAISCIQRDLPVTKDVLTHCATNIESAGTFHSNLLDIRKDHLNPIMDKQTHAAKSRLFFHLLYENDQEIYAKKIELMDQLETENNYGQPVRYYLAQVEANDDQFAAWVGAFNLEEGEDSIFMWDETYTELEPFNAYTVEEHKQRFFDRSNTEKEKDENEIHFEVNHQKHHVKIQGKQLFVSTPNETKTIPLHKIKKVTIESMKGGLFGLVKKEHIVIYDIQGEASIVFPIYVLDYGEFCYTILEQTDHLKEPPFLEYMEFE
ncbi:hypothetical protein [Bacillus sp. V59.32b]|uniref:hypothetical protein n=1 Tax=Bacillus sp. V59.32b TaxID=1758642 RepID=UPI000E3D07FA|nr:hypothetical protein [Bacillus sp. V59.32b]RFU60292.1 hypothetical protein D0463_17520 [Bacillus sp. V59.32b]